MSIPPSLSPLPGAFRTPDADAGERLLCCVAEVHAETHPGRSAAVRMDSDFERDLGLDSLARAELLLRVGERFGTSLPDRALAEARTAAELLAFLGAAVVASKTAAPAPELSGETALAPPTHALTLTEALDWHAARHPRQPHVLLYGEAGTPETIDYHDLREQARAIATGLVEGGVQPRQCVALMLPTSPEYLASFFGVMLAGAIPVPIYPPARLSQIEDHLNRHARILDNAQCVLMITVAQAKPFALLLRAGAPTLRDIVTPEELRRRPMPIVHRAGAQDIAFLQYTSGSTGDPKGVMLTHANLLANIRAMGEAARIAADDVFVSWLPLYHDMGLIGAWLAPLYFGFPLVLMSPLAFLARPARWLEAISNHRGTLSAAPNFAYELVAKKLADADLAGLDLSSWRFALNGAEPVSAATLEAVAARLAPVGLRRVALMPCYGLAECSVGLAFTPLGRGPRIERVSRRLLAEARRAAPPEDEADALALVGCGVALPGHAMRVVDELGGELSDGRVGRLQFRGPSACAGYYRNAEATRRLLAGDWRETGDYAYLAGGEVFITGREKDLIIRGGRNVYPYELEQAVGALPGVRRGCVAVFGSPDPATGSERLIVMAETRETEAAAREALRGRVNALAADLLGMPPEDVVLAPPHAVPKTSSGKIRRLAARELYERGLIDRVQGPLWLTMGRLALRAGAQRLRHRARTFGGWLYGAWVWGLFGPLAALLWLLVAALRRPDIGRIACHRCARLMLRLAGLPWRAQQLAHLPARAHVLVCNHASFTDAVYLVAALPPRLAYRFVAKREFTGHWLPRLFFEGIGTLFVERYDAKRSVEDADALAAALAAGSSLIVFPEGTFTRDPGLRPFRSGAFAAAARTGAPVAAAALRGTRRVLRADSWLPRREPVEFEIGATIAPTGSDWAAGARLREAARAEVLRLAGEGDAAGMTPEAS
jgi:1-acyl-sn-glycerol-3-phosphate acyltransferase